MKSLLSERGFRAMLECAGSASEGEGEEVIWSSEYRSTADALEPGGEEGRDKLRKAAGRSTYPVIRG